MINYIIYFLVCSVYNYEPKKFNQFEYSQLIFIKSIWFTSIS